jgi:glycosyltransferase involved in cell wall biosynthesis
MHLALITAGGAGMFCGSCMHDNTLARALQAQGHEVTLIPLYTPIRVDELDVSEHRVFLGGINVYLAGRWPWWSRLPRWLRSWLDSPAVLRFVSRFAVSSDARELGDLTIALLQGDHGPHREAISELVDWLAQDLRPDCVLLSNALLAGVVPRLRQSYRGPVWSLLQGDDIFLNDLVEPFRSQAFELMRGLMPQFTGLLTHSDYYRREMSRQLGFPVEQARVVPLGIDFAGHAGQPRAVSREPFTIGYFARICPEKGLHNLVEAFRRVHARHPHTRLRAAGFLGARDQAWFAKLRKDAADLGEAFEYCGSPPDHAGKVAFLQGLDLFSVPTSYREPKGLSILEALANGVPVVQPRHGSFPELLEATGGGVLVEPENAEALAAGLERLLLDTPLRTELAATGWRRVRESFSMDRMARETAAVLQEIG